MILIIVLITVRGHSLPGVQLLPLEVDVFCFITICRHRLFTDNVKRTRSTIWLKKNNTNQYLPVTKSK